LLESAAEGTPAYVYHLPTVRERARSLLDIEAIDRRFFAIKANPHPAILRALAAEGFGLECVSLGELQHVFETLPGLEPARVLFTPSFAPRAEYEAAFALGVTVTLDNVEALRNWPDIFRGRALWLRIDLGRGDGHHAKVVTGGAASKFGLPLAAFDDFVVQARALDARITGIHAHLGSGIATPAHWREVYAELAGFADSVGTVDTIDIGGGLPIPYKPEAHPFDLDAWAAGLAEIKAAYPRFALAVEPGRYMVAECGVLLARVTQVVEKQGIRRVGLDAGMNALMRPTLYRSEEHTSELQSRENLVCRLLLEKKKQQNTTHSRITDDVRHTILTPSCDKKTPDADTTAKELRRPRYTTSTCGGTTSPRREETKS